MYGRNASRAGVVAVGLVAALQAVAAPATAKGGSPGGGAESLSTLSLSTAYQTIASPGPLTEIDLGDELSCQVAYSNGSLVPTQISGPSSSVWRQFYPGRPGPADCGTFLGTGGTLYGPDFASHSAGSAASFSSYQAFGTVSQTPPTGSGSQSDPYIVTTVVDAGTTGLRVTRLDTYVRGRMHYRTDVVVTNTAASTQVADLYHGYDCYLQGSDHGTGYAATDTGAGTSRVGCARSGGIEQLTPLTAGNTYFEDHYRAVWNEIATRTPLPNCARYDVHDNAAAIHWRISLPPNGSVLRSFLTEFAGTGTRVGVTTSEHAVTEPPAQLARYAVAQVEDALQAVLPIPVRPSGECAVADAD